MRTGAKLLVPGSKLLLGGMPVVFGPNGVNVVAELFCARELPRQPFGSDPVREHIIRAKEMQQTIRYDRHVRFEERRGRDAVEKRPVCSDKDELYWSSRWRLVVFLT